MAAFRLKDFQSCFFFQLSDRQCRSKNVLASLLEDLFMGHEIIPDVLDKPPKYPLEVTYKTIRTFPGMKLTADLTRFKPMLHWPANPNSIYTVVMSNLDINNRKNRYVQWPKYKQPFFLNFSLTFEAGKFQENIYFSTILLNLIII